MRSGRTVGVIPARFASVRLPGKPLLTIGDKPLLQHVYERAAQAASLDEVIVATDDRRIFDAARAFGAIARMTRSDHDSGSDRVGEVAAELDAEFVVNIQGDEPFLEPAAIDLAVERLQGCEHVEVATLVCPSKNAESLASRHTAKVVLDENDFALYFSRAPIPCQRDSDDLQEWLSTGLYYEHIGLYVFRKAFLLQYVTWPPTPLEQAEKLEQLRILARGYRIICARTAYQPVCVDTPEDLAIARKLWKEMHLAD